MSEKLFSNARIFRDAAGRRLAFAICGSLALLLAAHTASASTVKLRIKVLNPRDTNQIAIVRANLPPRVTTDDVDDWGGLDWSYDTKNDIYYVHKNVPLAPREGKFFEVKIRDIWVIDPSEIQQIEKHVSGLVEKLKGTPSYEQAAQLQGLIETGLEAVAARQNQFAIGPGVPAIEHINAYETNLGELKNIKKDVGIVENLVLGSGQDVGALIGDEKLLSRPERRDDLPVEQYKTAVVEVVVINPSETEKKTISLRENLPEEIRVYDVLSSDGLEVGADFNTGACYVYKDGVELNPGEKKTFKISIRDKWNVNQPRVAALLENASNLLHRVQSQGRYPGVEDAIKGIVSDLSLVMTEVGPSRVDDQYVAFYRDQAGRVGLIEQRISRVESALKPIEKTVRFGFKVKPPSMKTTWALIYIILGFLGLFSVLFFLRWFGKSKGEKMGA